jgi:tRNA (guanine37-N1)-methyltransferase
MPKESACLKVPKVLGEKAIALSRKLKIQNDRLEIQKDENSLCIPITNGMSETAMKTLNEQLANFELSARAFPERKGEGKTLAEILEGELPSHLMAALPHSADIVGDIAVVEIPSELEAHRTVIGNAILKTNKNVKTVLAKAGAVSGTYRLREFNVVAGEPKTTTVHKEHGCQFYVDVARAYFSPRLSHEHNRVASLVNEGETVVDLFAGVGPFAVQIAKRRENVRVFAVDVNPDAVEFLKKNVRLNRVEAKVWPILGDARKVVDKKLLGVADRVIMNLPEKAMEFMDVACKALKPIGGIVHFYSFVNASDSLECKRLRFKEAVEESGKRLEAILFSKSVRETAPFEWQIVLDAKIC